MVKVLLAEDENTYRLLLATHLRNAGYMVDEAEDGQQAWEKLQASSDYALVVTDWRMPNRDGLSLFHQMQNDSLLCRIPVIMQTSANTQEEIREGIEAGVYYYLTKPFNEGILLSLVRSAIQEYKRLDAFEERLTRHEGALGNIVKGEFHIHTLQEAENMAFALGSLYQRPDLGVSGLYALLVNAVEHGNLQIGFEEKERLQKESRWEQEVKRRLELPENKNKVVRVEFIQTPAQVETVITDEGAGFDARPFLYIEPSRATKSNGRGIAKANMLCFDELMFLEKGNQVKAVGKK